MEDSDEFCRFLVGSYPSGISKNHKRALRRKCKNFTVKDGYKFAVIKISILELVPTFENKFLAGEKKFPGFWSHVMHHWKVDL